MTTAKRASRLSLGRRHEQNRVCSLAGLCALLATVWSLGSAHASAAIELPALSVSPTKGEITVDGNLSDPGWVGATTVEPFFEVAPADNVEPPVRTRAWISFDQSALYVAFDCDDPEPQRIRAPFHDRDRIDKFRQDLVAVMLDTRNDRRSAIKLMVNPRGLQSDAVFSESTAEEDRGPDFYFDSAAKLDARGWTAELRIPFASLNYSSDATPDWGITLMREYPRDFAHDIQSSPVPRGSNCSLCHMRQLSGLAGLPTTNHWVFAPFATAARATERDPPGNLSAPLRDQSVDVDLGLDLKWMPASNHTIDLALNPDFSQVESDVTQVGVNNRFALFYPEKRPLFLEGIDLFVTPLQAISTRTITDPDWGARATGKSGRTSYTLLIAKDAGGGSVVLPGAVSSDLAPQDFVSTATIGRLRTDLGESFAGLLLSSRELKGGGHNRVFGPDFQWRPNDEHQITGQLLFSDTRLPTRPDLASEWDGRSLRSSAGTLEWFQSTEKFVSSLQLTSIGSGFRDDNGFIPQVGYRGANLVLGPYFFRERPVHVVHPWAILGTNQTTSGDRLDRTLASGLRLSGPRSMDVDIRLHWGDQVRGRSRLFDQQFVELSLLMSPNRWFDRLMLEARLGDDVDFVNDRTGRGGRLKSGATLRPFDRLELVFDGERQWLNVDPGSAGSTRLFTATALRLKATLHLNQRSFVRWLTESVQTERDETLYNEPVERREASRLDSALLSYKLNWQTFFYLGYEATHLRSPDGATELADKRLFLKLAYAWRR